MMDSRYVQLAAWRRGRLPGYAPSFGELAAAALLDREELEALRPVPALVVNR